MSASPPSATSGERNRLAPMIVCAAIALVCIGAWIANLRMPLVRNGLVYARAAENVIAHGYDPRPVVADSTLSYDKPIGFAWLASPLVAAFGNHTGLRVASLLGTLAYLAAAAWFFRAYDPFGLSNGERAFALALCALNPLTVYQAWSAHPDSLFAALYLAAFVLTVRIVERPTLPRVAAWTVVIGAAIAVKNYGMVLVPSAGLFFVCNVRRALAAPGARRGVVWIALAFLVLFVFVASGWNGANPLVRFAGEGGGVEQYGKGKLALAAGGTLAQVGIALVLALNVASLLLLWRKSHDRRTLVVLASFPVAYVVGLMGFPTTFYNMRYFLPVLPFAALIAVHGMRALQPSVARLVRIVAPATGAVLVLVFNVEPVYARVEPAIPTLTVDWIGVPLSLLDNLRMPLHRAAREWIDNLNAKVARDGVVYLPDVFYYRDAAHGVYERAGLIRPDVRTRYVRSRDLAPSAETYWVQGPLRNPSSLDPLGVVTDEGSGLFRVDPRTASAGSERDQSGSAR